MGSTNIIYMSLAAVAGLGIGIYYLNFAEPPDKYTDGGPIDNRLAGGGTRRHRKHRKGSRKHRK